MLDGLARRPGGRDPRRRRRDRPGSVESVLSLVAIIPSAPLLVPELAGPAAADTEPVRTAVRDAGARLATAASRWIVVGATDGSVPAARYRSTGGFGAYGVPLEVDLRSDLGGDVGAGPGEPLPLSMLVAAWLREQSQSRAASTVSVTPVLIDPSASPEECAATGRELATTIAAAGESIGVLVVADGATALTPGAPGGGERPSAVALQGRIDAALCAADVTALGGLTESECAAEGAAGRAAWQVLAGLCAATDMVGESLYADAPFGVGYTVAVWTPARQHLAGDPA